MNVIRKKTMGGIVAGLVIMAAFTAAQAQSPLFISNLTVGSTGAEVSMLQSWLNQHGFTIPALVSGTAAPGYFGAQTQEAVKQYQAAHGIPNTGFVGPLTRAALNAGSSGPIVVQPPACPPGYSCTPISGSTNTSTVSNSGAEGKLVRFDLVGSISGEDVDEGERNVQVLGVEFEAQDSDIRIERIDVDFTPPATGSRRLTDYIQNVSIWLDGTRLGSLDASSVKRDNNDEYSFRFTGLRGTVREGDSANLYVAVDAVKNVDSRDTGSWNVRIPTNGIRATDEAGISETYVQSKDNLAEMFSVGASNAGELDVTENDSNPSEGIVIASSANETTGVTLMTFDLTADQSRLDISDVPVGIVTPGTSVKSVIKSLKLVRGSNVLKSKSIPATATGESYQIIFNDLDLRLNDGDTMTLKVVADINKLGNSFNEGDSVYATTTGSSSAWDVEDSNGDDVTPDGSVTGNIQVFYKDGLAVALTDTNARANTSGVATFEISFDVTALGKDIYLSAGDPDAIATDAMPSGVNVGAQYSTSSDAIAPAYISSADLLAPLKSGDIAGSYYKISQGQTRSFKLQVVMSNNSTTDIAKDRVALRSLNWSTTTDSAGFVNHYTYNMRSFMTDPVSWKTSP